MSTIPFVINKMNRVWMYSCEYKSRRMSQEIETQQKSHYTENTAKTFGWFCSLGWTVTQTIALRIDRFWAKFNCKNELMKKSLEEKIPWKILSILTAVNECPVRNVWTQWLACYRTDTMVMVHPNFDWMVVGCLWLTFGWLSFWFCV